MKKSIKIIITLLITFCIINVMQNSGYAYEEDWNKIKQDAKTTAFSEGSSMSAETLKEKIDSFQAEIEKKANNSNYDQNAKDVDQAKLSGYKNAYYQKTGETYTQTSSGNGNIGSQGSIADPILNPGAYDPTQTNVETTKTTSIVKTLVKIMTTVGIAVAIISLMVIGIRFMVGSVEDRAKYKETMMPYIIGTILLFSISGILQVLSNLFFNIGG